jgi:carbon storage regulator
MSLPYTELATPLWSEEKQMLVLSRKPGEKVRIGSDITLTVIEVKGNRVRIGIEAPNQVAILRRELDATTDAFLTVNELPEPPLESGTFAAGVFGQN